MKLISRRLPPAWDVKVRQALQRCRGVRLGEAAVVSRQVHLSDVRTPELVTICTSADAGQTFYGRPRPGEMVHLDIFHAVAEVDHRRVAEALIRTLGGVPAFGDEAGGRLLLDYFDLVTATGGGRVTGDLTYGRSASLRAAHRNHVHLAGLLPDHRLNLLLPLVAAVEEELMSQGVEPRRVERLAHGHWSGGAPMDLSAYADPESDSLLANRTRTGQQGGGWGQGSLRQTSWRQPPASGAGQEQSLRQQWSASHGGGGGEAAGIGGGAAGGFGASGAPAASGRRGAGTGSGMDSGSDSGFGRGLAGGSGSGSGPGAPAPGAGQGLSAGAVDPWAALDAEAQMQEALALSRSLGSPEEMKRVLDELARGQGWSSLYGSGSSQAPYLMRQLEEAGLIRRDVRGMRLTEKGRALAAFMDQHLREVKLRFRKLIRRIPATRGRPGARRPGRAALAPSPDVRYGPVRGTAPAAPGAWLTDLAVPETIRAALVRGRMSQLGASQTGGPVARPPLQPWPVPAAPLQLQRQDIHVHLRAVEPPLHICLLIDASASMAGRRILAAKHLARHLLVSTRDRIAVIAFQERDVRVHVPFTRNYGQVETGLANLQPMGLTPLADGLVRSVELIRASRVRYPLLLLITDGIPTVPKWSVDPLADGLEAARQVARARIPFGCVGLQPSRRYLAELTRAAGGTLHVVEELDEQSLVHIAHSERRKTMRWVR